MFLFFDVKMDRSRHWTDAKEEAEALKAEICWPLILSAVFYSSNIDLILGLIMFGQEEEENTQFALAIAGFTKTTYF